MNIKKRVEQLEWSALRDFVAVVENGSLSAAARVLLSSQPTIGRRIDQLEQALNATLFNRTPQGLQLTETGERILDYARRMADEASAIERIAGGANQRLEGAVRVTMTDMMGNRWLPPKLPEFYQRFPGLRLETSVDNRALDLLRREADIAVRFARPRQLDLVTRHAISLNYGLYASHDYLTRHPLPKHIRDFRGHSFVSYDEAVFRNASLKRIEHIVGLERILHRSTSNSGVLEAIKQGVGMGITGCYFADREPQLQRLLSNKIDYSFDIWVVTHEEFYKSARIRAVFDFLAEKLEQDRALFNGRRGH